MTSFWDRYGRIALGVLGVLGAAGVAAFFTLRARTAAENEASGQLTEANYFFWQGDYARSLQVAKQLAEQFPSTWSGVDALRLAGDDAFWNGDWKTAIDYYRKYLDKNKSGVVSDAVRRGYAYALVGKFDRESSGEFLSAAARCYRALGQPAEASKRLQRVLDEFGETSHAMTARVRMGELGTPAP